MIAQPVPLDVLQSQILSSLIMIQQRKLAHIFASYGAAICPPQTLAVKLNDIRIIFTSQPSQHKEEFDNAPLLGAPPEADDREPPADTLIGPQ